MEKLKKRDGRVVEYNPAKIWAAMEKAFRAVRGRAEAVLLEALTGRVSNIIEKRFFSLTPDVEQVQDIVEQVLMESGHFDIVRAYILYRERRRQVREEKRREALEYIKSGRLNVVKRNGSLQPFDERKLRKYFLYAIEGYQGVVPVNDLVEQCELGLHEGITTVELSELAVMTARNFIERDPCYMDIAARLFLQSLYREVLGGKPSGEIWDARYRETFMNNINRGVAMHRLSPKMAEFNAAELAEALDVSRDKYLGFIGLQTLSDRYFLHDIDTGRCLETPQAFWMRVAMGLSLNEPEKEKRAREFYEVLSSLRYVCSTPTLFHAGTTYPQLSSCYLSTIEDDLAHIFKSYSDNAQLSKWSGGLGNDWSNVRATGALIKTTGVPSQGIVPFLKIANDTTVAINRSGKRRGATCAYLETWHLDIEDFLDLRRNTGDERRRTHDMNTANWVPDLFIKRVLENGDWTLFSPEEVPDLHHKYGRAFEAAYTEYERRADRGEMRLFRKVKASDLWKKMITRLFETGHPWLTFKDPSNIRSPQDHIGVVHGSNLCTEITLNTSREEVAVCNLGSINLPRHIDNNQLDRKLLSETVATAMRMLDNVIDINYYPVPEARTANLRHRAVGLGIMGFQDALYNLGYNFDGDRAIQFADESMEIISYQAILASAHLAEERGVYETYPGSKWERGIFPQDTLDLLEQERGMMVETPREGKLDWVPVREAVKQYGMRNSNCLAIAPTATIANISGCYPSIEPIYKNLYVKSNMSGEFTMINKYLVNDLKALGLWNGSILEEIKAHDGSVQKITVIPEHIRARYKTAFEIEPEYFIRAAAARGKWIDQSQSLNLFLTTNSGKEISDVYLRAWRSGLKTTYYLRTMAKSGIEKSTVDISRAYGSLTMKKAAEKIPTEVAGNEESGPVCAVDNPECEACQ